MRHSFLAQKSGFTLIELLIVMSIIGLLSSMIIPNYAHIKNASKENALKNLGHSTQIALETHKLITGTYPLNTSLSASQLFTTLKESNSLTSDPKNPFTSQIFSETDTSGKISYTYLDNEKYEIYIYGTNNQGPISILTNN
jgi:general secretion pathway protein G